jgi:tRNA pseudouridine32 synthase/23S rRNA pseudouridine746 synthase/23S rRNA pseudouridine1911/1915/1917 synthase
MTGWDELRRERAVYEDDRLLVLDKPPEVSVLGERRGTDLVRLARDAGARINPAHRIDKVTSGLVALAKTTEAHGVLTRQFAKRQATKQYLAVVVGSGLPASGRIDLPLLTAASGRVRVAAQREAIGFDPSTATYSVRPSDVLPGQKNYPSQTGFEVVATAGGLALLSLEPVTGRRHQIRVHLAWIGYPIAGDPLFRSTSRPDQFGRTYLHAFRLGLDLPWHPDGRLTFQADPDPGFLALFPGASRLSSRRDRRVVGRSTSTRRGEGSPR